MQLLVGLIFVAIRAVTVGIAGTVRGRRLKRGGTETEALVTEMDAARYRTDWRGNPVVKLTIRISRLDADALTATVMGPRYSSAVGWYLPVKYLPRPGREPVLLVTGPPRAPRSRSVSERAGLET
ncbi:hypothetical protein ABIA35_007430 [Catenulispora sp. MAP12-49]|uniref:hypothetical protein n=1 Tax=Catenulispora sp. MAP12-49 TaxID=3156302 RepID=UPI0035189700